MTGLDAALDQVLGTAAPKPRPTPTAPARGHASDDGLHLAQVRPRDLIPDPDNPRDDVGDVTELAESIRAVGLLQPIIARRTAEGRLVVVAGHRRLAAVQELGLAAVPVVIRRDMRPDDVLAAMLVENGQRADLDPIEEARALARIRVSMGDVSHGALARRVGFSQPRVSARLALLALTPAEQDAVRSGETTLGNATRRAREANGTARPAGSTGSWHLSDGHELARQAKNRCDRQKHARARRVGGVACGACWESVIRADERQGLHGHAERTGRCPICDHAA